MAQKQTKSSPFDGKSDDYHERREKSPKRKRSNDDDGTEDVGMTSSSG